jgi:hypothetical protein
MMPYPIDALSMMRDLVRDFHWTSLSNLRHVIDTLDVLAAQIHGQDPGWDPQKSTPIRASARADSYSRVKAKW